MIKIRSNQIHVIVEQKLIFYYKNEYSFYTFTIGLKVWLINVNKSFIHLLLV